jgi:uncharacterized membrane protein YeaQ/YmgE (transglycosylase-associated protein family)
MGILTWVVLGLIAGFLAQWLMPGKSPGGWIVTILLGIGGALVGGFLAIQLGFGDVTGINLHSILIAVGGAVLLLFVYGLLKKKNIL